MTKYRAKRTEVDGISFASKAESRRYQQLKLMERARLIKALRLQPKYPLRVGKDIIGHYVADFEYEINGDIKIEDVKGFKTDLYRWKKKHFEAQFGIPITEVQL